MTDRDPLVGNWKSVSMVGTLDGKPGNPWGENPVGYLILTPEGRMMAVLTANNRKIPTSDADAIELMKTTMAAYTGKYRLEGDDFVTTVDVAWDPVWAGTEQRRHYKLEGDKFTIVTAPRPLGYGPQKDATVVTTLVWQREKQAVILTRGGRRVTHRRAGACRRAQGGVSGFPHALEGCRPRHPHLQASQGGVRETEVDDCKSG